MTDLKLSHCLRSKKLKIAPLQFLEDLEVELWVILEAKIGLQHGTIFPFEKAYVRQESSYTYVNVDDTQFN